MSQGVFDKQPLVPKAWKNTADPDFKPPTPEELLKANERLQAENDRLLERCDELTKEHREGLERLDKMKAEVETLRRKHEQDLAKLLHRRGGPSTSREGAEYIAPNLSDLHREVIALIREYPGRTANELSDIAGDRDPRRIGRRLTELRRMKKIADAGIKECTVTGRNAQTYKIHEGDTNEENSEDQQDGEEVGVEEEEGVDRVEEAAEEDGQASTEGTR